MSKDKGCVGSYPVSGYTRRDGVEVSGYTRSCGAAHASQEDKMQRRADILYPSMKQSKNEKFTGGAAQIEKGINEKIQHRADVLYGSDEDYIRKYYAKDRETNILKRYEDMEQENFKQKIQDKGKEIEIIKSNNFRFSDSELAKAREFIQGEEDFRADAYKPTPNDVWTIGYGHTGLVDGKPITPGMIITKEKAEELYRKDFEMHTSPLKKVDKPLTSNQKIALASLIYNIGVNAFTDSDIHKKLNVGDYQGAANEFDRWIYQKGKILKGLVNRRKAEKELFLTPDN